MGKIFGSRSKKDNISNKGASCIIKSVDVEN